MPEAFRTLLRFNGRAEVGSHDPGEEKVSWYQSSEKARRGFCSTCGSSLFWDPLFRDWIGIAMGSFDGSTGTRLHVHIYVADKGDYHAIADGVEEFEQVPVAPQP